MNRCLFAVVLATALVLFMRPTTEAKQPSTRPPVQAEAGVIHFPATDARRWTLPNGLTIIVQEDHSAPVASVQAWCETGSITEDKQLGAGLSHILEHMLFKGTATRHPNEIAQAVQNAGGYINAYTSFDRTVFWIDIPAKGVATAIDILSDAMMNSTLPPEEYTKEQEVIRREFAMGYDNPDRMSSLTLFANAFSVHPYRHPVIGHIEVYNKLTREDVMAYYKSRYVPNNLFFVVTGDVDAEKVYQQLGAYFEKYPRQALAPVYIPQEPPQLGRREEHKEFPTELSRMDLAWHIPEITHPDVPALDMLSVILGNGRSSRLYKKLREETSLVHSISAWCYTPGQPGLFGVEMILDPDKRDAARTEILAILDELKRNGVTPEELAKAKKQTLSGHLEALTTTHGRAADLGSNWILTRNLNFTHDYLESVQRVTQADIDRALHTWFDNRNLTVTSLNPPGSMAAAKAPATAPAAGEIQKFDLPNGLRLLVREDPRLPLVSAVACFKAGLLAETPRNNGISGLFAKTILKGTETRSAEEIAEQIESIGGNIGSDAGNNSFSVSIKTMQSDLKTGLELLSDVLLHPAFPEKAVAREKQAQLAAIKTEEEQMTSVARNLMRRTLYAGHPYGLRANGSAETVAGLNREQLAAFRNQFVAGRNCVLAIFGNVKAAEVKTLVEQTLGAMPAGEAALVKPPVPPPFTVPQMVEEHKQKSQAIVMVAFRGTDIFSHDRHALELIDEASSDLGSRFFIRIREKLGLAYFVGSSQAFGLVPGPFVFYLGTSPAKVETVRAEFLDEIGHLAKDGLTGEELRRAKAKLLGQQEIRNQDAGAFAYACALDELYGLGFDEYAHLRSQVEAVTLDDVKAVARKYFDGQPSVLAIVRPEPKTRK